MTDDIDVENDGKTLSWKLIVPELVQWYIIDWNDVKLVKKNHVPHSNFLSRLYITGEQQY